MDDPLNNVDTLGDFEGQPIFGEVLLLLYDLSENFVWKTMNFRHPRFVVMLLLQPLKLS